MLKSIFGHVKTVVTLGKTENNYDMLFEDSQFASPCLFAIRVQPKGWAFLCDIKSQN